MLRHLLWLFFLALHAAGAGQYNRDSLLQVLPGLPEDSVRVQVLLDLSWAYFRSDLNKSLDYANRTETLARKLGLTEKLAASKRIKSFTLSGLGNYREADSLLVSALADYRLAGNQKMIANCYSELGWLKRLQNDPAAAVDYFGQAIDLAGKAGDINTQAQAYNYLAGLYADQKQYDKAIENYEEALERVRQLDIQPGISACLTNLAAVYTELGQNEKAIALNREALPIKEATGDLLGAGRVLNNLGIAFNELSEYARAREVLQRADSLAREVGNERLVNTVGYSLSVTAYGLGEYRRSIDLCQRLLDREPPVTDLELLSKIYRRLYLAYGALGDYQRAFESAENWGRVTDSLYDENILKATNEIEARYQSERKNQEIALLASEKSLQQLQLNKRVNERNGIIGLSLLVLLLAGLIYNQYRLKQRSNLELQELDRLKSGFFANISHEFRTPLTLIKGPIEKLEQNPGETLSREEVRMIRRNTQRVLGLVNQLLDLSRIDQGELRLKPTEGDVFKCLRAAASAFNSHAAQRRMDYSVRIPTDSLWASFDRDKIEQVVYNLLSNAFKFCEDGGTVAFEATYKDELLTMQVADSGRGIPSGDLPYIFDRFYQAQGGMTRDREGSGIGLALSRDLVELMDGTITVESEEGEGARFTVQLPLRAIRTRGHGEMQDPQNTLQEAEPPKAFAFRSPDRRNLPLVLLVEDNPDMRQFICDGLIDAYRTLTARDGEEGLKLAISRNPDLVITDLMMPRMDGVEMTEKLKTRIETSHIPVVMLTARAGMENKLEGLETGADDYLTKPFDTRELRVRVANLIRQRQRLRDHYQQQAYAVVPEEVTATSLDQQFLERLHALLEAEHADPEFGLPQMQRSLGMSKTQLHRKVRALTNTAPGTLLRNFRLDRAAQLLRQDADTVTQVAYQVGFNNLSYFSKCFRERHGASPSTFCD